MERNNLWMIGMIIIIVCLVVTSFQIRRHSNNFKEECGNYFDINDTCPCTSSKTLEIGNYTVGTLSIGNNSNLSIIMG